MIMLNMVIALHEGYILYKYHTNLSSVDNAEYYFSRLGSPENTNEKKKKNVLKKKTKVSEKTGVHAHSRKYNKSSTTSFCRYTTSCLFRSRCLQCQRVQF